MGLWTLGAPWDSNETGWWRHTLDSSYRVIVRVKVVLKRTVVGDWRFDNLSGSHLQSQDRVTWLWRWLPLKLLKRQSPTTVLFRTTFPGQSHYELLIFLGSNHLQWYSGQVIWWLVDTPCKLKGTFSTLKPQSKNTKREVSWHTQR